MAKLKITARKDGGDDEHSWAVFVNGKMYFNGMSRSQVKYYKQLSKEIAEKKIARGELV